MFQYLGNQYRISFQYSRRSGRKTITGPEALSKISGKKIKTSCFIQQKKDGIGWETIVSGETIRNPEDAFSKKIARNISFDRAAAQLRRHFKKMVYKDYTDQFGPIELPQEYIEFKKKYPVEVQKIEIAQVETPKTVEV